MTTPKILRDINTFLAKWFPVDYDRYIQSSHWKRKAAAAKARALNQCQGCGRPGHIVTLNAHHRTYTRLGYEIPEDLTVLCQPDCHPAIARIRRQVYGGAVRFTR